MAEYIEREAALRICERLRDKNAENHDMAFALNWAMQSIERIRAVDVVEARRGHWVDVEVKELAYYKMMIASMRCDQCGRYHNEVYHYGNPTEMAKYCGFCGARMDGDGDV